MNTAFYQQRPPPAERSVFRVAAALLAVALVSCAGSPANEAEWDRRTTRLLKARKATSQAAVERDRIAGVPADQYVNRRTALLLGGNGKITTEISANGRTAVVGWELRPGQGAGAVSSAAAITDDGYFLTAAHAVSDERMQVVRSNDRGVDVARARVVWKGDAASGGPDLALIHAPVKRQPFFPLVDPDASRPWGQVWTGGFGDVRQNQSCGRLRSFGPWQRGADEAPWRVVEHSAPLMRGDSGGPLVDGGGRLLGVNTEFLVQPASLLGVDHLRIYRPMAVAADPRWVEEIIAADRAARSGASRSKRRGRG